MAPPRRHADVTAAEWVELVFRFRLLRDVEIPDVYRRASKLEALVKTEAQALYDLANTLGRGEPLAPTTLARHQARPTFRRVIKQGRFSDDVVAEYLRRLEGAPGLDGDVDSLRRRADATWELATILGQLVGMRAAARAARVGGVGALPSVAMDYLIQATDAWHATIREVAERLVEYGAELPSEDRADEPEHDAVARWIGILEDARPRSRKRLIDRSAELTTQNPILRG